ncbi:MAG: response regulator, partial [Gaiellaceae bacterium]
RPWAPAGLTVALADDSVLLREGVAALLEDAGLDVVGQAGTAEDLLAVVDSFRPNIAIIDIRMPPTGPDEGIRAAAEIQARYPETSVLLLSSHVDVENAVHLFRNGVSSFGYLLKDRVADVDEFVQTVGLVARGGIALDSSIVNDLQSGLWSEKVRDDLFVAIAEAAIVGD